MKIRHAVALLACTVVAGCASQSPPAPQVAAPIPLTPPAEQDDAPVVRREAPPVVATPRPPQPFPPERTAPGARPAIAVPADAIYVCVVDERGTPRQTVIEFASPRVHDLCRRHPEMGPCQYERNVCRSAGGRVYAAGGREITLATEAEYDRKVMRVRFRAN
jgi:hypothetical protein